MPQELTYDPFESPANMRKLLLDLTTWTLAMKIHHRLAGTCKNLLGMWLKIDEHEKLEAIEERLAKLEAEREKA
jgi:hypothetical protein